MSYCPNVVNKDVVDDFNSIVEHFGGQKLTEQEFKDPQLRDKRKGINKTAMDATYYLWDKYAGDKKLITADANYTGKSISEKIEESLSKYLVKDLDAIRQEQITNSLTRKINRELLKNPNADINTVRNNVLKAELDRFKRMKSEIENSDIPTKEKILNGLLNPVIDNFTTLSNLVNIKLKRINNLASSVNDDINLEQEEASVNEKLDFNKSSYEAKIELDAELKRIFSDIDSGTKNALGEVDSLDGTYVESITRSILAGIPQDYELMKDRLLEYVEAYPWVTQLVDKLDAMGVNTRNKFVTSLTCHYVEHTMGMWSKVKGKAMQFVQVIANQNAISKNIFDSWKANLNNSKYLDSEGVLHNKKEVVDRFEKILKDGNPDEARQLLEDLGITISDKFWDKIVKGQYKLNKKDTKTDFKSFLNNNNSPFLLLYKNIKLVGSKNIEEYDVFKDTAFKNLSKEDAKYNKQILSTSHRVGNKTVQSYGLNKYIIDFVRELKFSGLAQRILTSGGVYANESIILKNFAAKNTAFTDNFRIGSVSLLSIKKMDTKDRDGKELHNLNEDEYEMQELINLNAPQTDESNTGQRIGTLNSVTNSDKSTAMTVRTVLAKIKLENGELAQESIDLLYEQAVLPEIRRIKQWENIKKSRSSFPNKEFEQGGHMFLLIPSMNNMNDIWEKDGSLNKNVESVEFRSKINDEIMNVVNSLVAEKLELWTKYGIVTENSKGVLEPTMLDLRVFNEHKIFEGSRVEDYSKVVATDMVFQYIINNANIFTGIVGDAANFYKSKVYKEESKKLVRNNLLAKEDINDRQKVWATMSETTRLRVVKDIFDNVGKRLAMHIAPGKSSADYEGKVKYIFANDRAVDSKSLDQYKVLIGNESKDYSKEGILSEGTNAQEFTTYLEHLHNMDTSGLLPLGFYNEIASIVQDEINKGNHYYEQAIKDKLSDEFKDTYNHLVLQVTKPVYSWFEVGNTGLTPMYIKTSAYPLIPSLTSGLDMDNIRIAMEKNGLHRLSFASGTKLGMPVNAVNLWDENNNIRTDIPLEEIEGASKELPRMGFRIQQEVPYEELKDAINRVSQADKNLFTNLLSITGFKYRGKEYTGAELQKEYEQHYTDLYKSNYSNLIKKLNVQFDARGNIKSLDRDALKKTLLEEATQRGYPINDIESLNLDDALDYISFMPSAAKYEALLNSIVKNKVLKMKFRGKSFVLSTEEGYQSNSKSEDDLTPNEKSGIKYTPKWKGSLDPGHFEDATGKKLTGKELAKAFKEGTAIVKTPAQVFIPWKFQWGNEKLNINDFVDPEINLIDTSKLPEELLNLFGMRIPNQGANSQSWMEIAGFLPKECGDIIVAPRDFLAQMGSDFDVDKLYSYMYNYMYKDSKLSKLRFNSKEEIEQLKEETLTKLAFTLNENEVPEINKEAKFIDDVDKVWQQELQNRLLDIHIALHQNTNMLVQSQIVEPLGFWKFKEIADEIDAAKEINKNFTPLSDSYQRDKRLNAAMGKALVGDFANLMMFNAVAQGKDLHFVNKDGNNIHFRFGSNVSNGDLSGIFTLKTLNKLIFKVAATEKLDAKEVRKDINTYLPKIQQYLDLKDITFKSQVISGLASAAVDNEKEQILDKLFLNSDTSKYVKLLAQLGFGEEVAYFVKQPIIVDYFNELKRLKSSLGDFTPNADTQALFFAISKYGDENFSKEKFEKLFDKGHGLSIEAMKQSILNPGADFNYIQQAALSQLMYLKKYADKLQLVQSVINTDSKGLDKSLFETISKEEIIDRLNTSGIANVNKVLEGTINGAATEYGLRFNNKLWGNFFPYTQDGVTKIFNIVENIFNKDEIGVSEKSDIKNTIWKNFKSYLFTLQNLGLLNQNIDAERKRLMLDTKDNKSLATKIKMIQNLPKFINDPFISRLVPYLSKGAKPSTLSMNTNVEPSAELYIMQAAASLYTNVVDIPTIGMNTRELFEDLVKSAYINGGVQEFSQYLKFMPVSYLQGIGFTTNMSNLVREKFFEDNEKLDIPNDEMPNWVIPTFVQQYFQHDQRGLPQLSGENLNNSIIPLEKDNNYVTNNKLTSFALTNTDYYTGSGRFKEPPIFLVIPSAGRFKGLSKNILFIYQGIKTEEGQPIYTRVANLGMGSTNEYNFGIDNATSMINQYNPIYAADGVEQKDEKYPTEKGYSEEYDNPESSKENVEELLRIVPQGDTKDIQDILDNITINSSDVFQQVLAREFIKLLDKENVSLDSTSNMEGTAGSYKDNKIYLNLNSDKNKTVEGVAETMLHETIHHFINSSIKEYEKNPKNVSPETRDAIKELKRLQSIYNARIKDKYGDKYATKLDAIKGKKYDLLDTNDELMEIYASQVDKLNEFVTLTTTNKHIQEVLNDINDPDNKNKGLLDKLSDLLNKLLSSLGFNVNKNSLLEGALKNSLILINGNNSRTLISDKNTMNYEEQPKDSMDEFYDINPEYGKDDFYDDYQTVESFLPSKDRTNPDEVLRKFGELNSQGRVKLVPVDRNGGITIYNKMIKKAQNINNNQTEYTAKVGTTSGEEVRSNGRQYYYIKLIPREENILNKYNSISRDEILDEMRKCRG